MLNLNVYIVQIYLDAIKMDYKLIYREIFIPKVPKIVWNHGQNMEK